MAEVYIVRRSGGEYDNRYEYNVKAFLKMEDAVALKEKLDADFALERKQAERISVWFHRWMEANPRPEYQHAFAGNSIEEWATPEMQEQMSWHTLQKAYDFEYQLAHETTARLIEEWYQRWNRSYECYAKSFGFTPLPDGHPGRQGNIADECLHFDIQTLDLG